MNVVTDSEKVKKAKTASSNSYSRTTRSTARSVTRG